LKFARGFFGAVVLTGLLFATAPEAQAQDLAAKTARVRELVGETGQTRFVTPAPGSRSTVLAVDTSTALFFFLERGSVRGTVINEFYAALDAGDMEGAYQIFNGNSIITVRATDYGWNGLGVPFVAASGNEIADVLFKDMGGTFRRAESISAEDLAMYEELLDAVIAALEGS
jgi:hypothetical protein